MEAVAASKDHLDRVLNPVHMEVSNVILATGQRMSADDVEQLVMAVLGLMHNNEKMYHNNELVVL